MDRDEIVQAIIDMAEELMKDWPSNRDRQKDFVYSYISNGFRNGAKSAREAQYSEKSANKQANNMLKGMDNYGHIPPVIEKLENEFNKLLKENKVARPVDILLYLTRLMNGEEKEMEMINVGDFQQELVEVPVKHSVRRQAAVDLGRYYSMWTDKVDQTNHNIEIVIGDE